MSGAARSQRVGTGVLVLVLNSEGRFVMGKRAGAHGAGTWSAPGGRMEFGESPEGAARREVAEEIGVEISNPTLVTVTNDVFSAEGLHFITLWLVARLASGEPQICEPDKLTELGWFSLDSLPDPLFLPWHNVDRPALRMAIAHTNGSTP